MIIDFQAHFFRIEFMQFFEGRKDYPRLVREQGRYKMYHGEGHGHLLDDEGSDMEARLRHMDQAGVDMQVLTPGPPAVYSLEKKDGVRASRELNDYLAEVISKYPGRFAGLATLPLQDTDEAIKELDRAIGQLKLHGLLIHSNLAGRSLDDPMLLPVYERVHELNIVIYIHPIYPLMANAMLEYGLLAKVGYMVDTSLATLKLIYSGVLEKFPRLKIIHPHMGAIIPYLMERIEAPTQVPTLDSKAKLAKTVRDYYNRIYTDSACQGPATFKFGYEFFGPDRIVFGSDYPFYMSGQIIQLVKGMGLPEEAERKIFSENAKKLLKI